MSNGVLDYTDNLTGQPFKYGLSEISVDSKDIKNQTDWLSLTSSMLLNGRGNLIAEIGTNPNDYSTKTTVNIAIGKFMLPDLNIYTDHYVGHNAVQGDMYYYSNFIITNCQMQSDNRLVIKNTELEVSGRQLNTLPLKFAFFLLTDKNGDVNLDVLVRGNLNDPSVDIGTIVWNTFKNVIVKTTSAPLGFLVGLVDGDPEELKEIAFIYTDTIPTSKHVSQFD